MIKASEIYSDVAYRINKASNGELTYTAFNSLSWLAQLRLIDWLTGSMSGQEPPEPYLTQKNRDWLSDFIVSKPYDVVGGEITRPDDYYQFENFYSIGSTDSDDCEDTDEDAVVGNCNRVIALLSNDRFNQRCNTHIKTLRPSFNKIIAKQVGKKFIISPSDVGSVTLEYIRLPLRAEIKTTLDSVYNEQVVNEATTINFEWDEKAREVLIYFITQQFLVHSREAAGTQLNELVGKTVRK